MIHKFLVRNLWQEKESYFLCPPSKRGMYIALLLSVCQSVGRGVRSFSSQRINIGNRFFTRISRSSSVLGTIEQTLIELCPSHIEKSNFFPFNIITAKVEQIHY